MENFIKNLKISNFKSIRHAELECGRVNLFVGKPNVGKSNVLEALSLLGANYSTSDKFMEEFIRYEELSNWFTFDEIEKQIKVESEIGYCDVWFDANDEFFKYLAKFPAEVGKEIEKRKYVRSNGIDVNGRNAPDDIAGFKSPVRRYIYKTIENIGNNNRIFLNPPYGDNLFQVMQSSQLLRDELPDLFGEYKLDFIIDKQRKIFEILRREGVYGYKIPYQLIADTLRRIIFHYAAILSNDKSILIFEEPESHSFPPYVSDLAYKISQDHNNQYFVATHSPHFFTRIVEESDDPAIFITYLDEFETKFKKLNNDEICELLDYGIDIFFNAKYFLDEPSSENIA